MPTSVFSRRLAGLFLVAAAAISASPIAHGAEIVGIGGNCLDVTGGVMANGTRVQMWRCEGGHPNQQWIFEDLRIVWAGTRKCLDVTDGRNRNGTHLQIWDCQRNNPNQQFELQGREITWLPDGTNPSNASVDTRLKCLDVERGGTSNGTNVQIWDCKQDNPNQRWSVRGQNETRVPQVPIENKVCFYERPNYGGASYCASPGIDTPDADRIRLDGQYQSWNKRIQSIQLRGSAKVTVWEGKNYTGPSITLTYSSPDLSHVKTTQGELNWSNSISSYKAHF